MRGRGGGGLFRGMGAMLSGAGSSLSGMAGSAMTGIGNMATSAYSGAKNMASSAYQGTKNLASSAYQGTKNLASSAYQGTKNMASSAYQGAKGMATRAANALSPSKALERIGGLLNKGTAMKVFKSIAKVPIIGPLISGLFMHGNIQDMIAEGITGKELHAAIGTEVLGTIGGTAAGAIAAAAVNSLNAVGIPGFLLSSLAYMGGDFLGRSIVDLIGGQFPGLVAPIGKFVHETFYGDGSAPSAKMPEAMNDFQYFSGASGAPIRANSSDVSEGVAVKEGGVLAKKLDKLISLMSENGSKEIVIKVDRKEIARAAISGINNDYYSTVVRSM